MKMDWDKATIKAAVSLARAHDATDRRLRVNPNAAAHGGPCTKCGAVTKARSGRYGEFFGCTLYPKCSGTWKPP